MNAIIFFSAASTRELAKRRQKNKEGKIEQITSKIIKSVVVCFGPAMSVFVFFFLMEFDRFLCLVGRHSLKPPPDIFILPQIFLFV